MEFQTDKQTDRQTDRQTNRQTDKRTQMTGRQIIWFVYGALIRDQI